MGIKEILAAKKLAAATSVPPVSPEISSGIVVPASNSSIPLISTEVLGAPKSGKTELSVLEGMGIISQEVSAEETNAIGEISIKLVAEPTQVQLTTPVVAGGKKETFSEMIARKKREKETGVAVTVIDKTEEKKDKKPKPQIVLSPAQVEILESVENDAEAQAYTDICMRINSLQYSEDGEDLSKAMDDLKVSLHKNASACLLMLESDIGQMAISLRRLVGIEMAPDPDKKKAGKKASNKQISLTDAVVGKVLDIPDDM